MPKPLLRRQNLLAVRKGFRIQMRSPMTMTVMKVVEKVTMKALLITVARKRKKKTK
jgi:hypothetical protein